MSVSISFIVPNVLRHDLECLVAVVDSPKDAPRLLGVALSEQVLAAAADDSVGALEPRGRGLPSVLGPLEELLSLGVGVG